MEDAVPPSAVGSLPLSKKKKTVEQTYQKLSQLEHILLRPDTYIGSAQRAVQPAVHVWDASAGRIVSREVSFAPGLYKIFDEILVNAADHKQRCPTMKSIRVDIEPENCKISVWNDGKGIPIQMHEKERVYVPELIFGHLLTSSNYDDDEKKVVGGRNGYGAKLANIFSTQFVVETADSESGNVYKQVFKNNMTVKGKPAITASRKKSEDWTCITFYPDLPKFGMDHLDDDIVALMSKRVYDIAGTNPSIRVTLNGSRLPIKSFKDYIRLYHERDPEVPFIHEKSGDRWEIAVGASEGQLEQVSFVNSIWTIKGGAHVSHVVDQIVSRIQEHVAKKNKGLKLKPHQVKTHLSVFVNALIENPAFDSQTKETLTSKPSQFGSKCHISDEAFKKILNSGIVASVTSYAMFKQSKELAKSDGGKKGRVSGIPKLDDANKAGGREASKCTLILTEGDSAKALAISGLSVIGRDYYGVFPLRGKLLNVREASHKQIMDNAEISSLKKILGLQQGKKYTPENINSLRYGHILIMTDQDHDGSHIKGLLINFFNHFWPALLQADGFLQEFVTPIVKCFKGKTQKVFFTMPEYKQWIESAGSGWKSKYYKGLGSSTPQEAKEYFSDLCRHLHKFCWNGEGDGKMIELAFAKSRVNDRKQWLSDFQPGTYLDLNVDELNYTNFINKELILFSIADNERSIPSVVDGLKPSQRKVLFGCFKRKLTKNEVKVFQLSGYISEHAAYHHGDASLQATIIGLAQNFVGSNNANLLVPAGQFGTRLQGGKDAASSRYICTKLAPVARAIFPEVDDPLLAYLEDDGLSIEPRWYCPIIPTVLLNGAEGIGTGWSSQVPCYNPKDLIANVRLMIQGEEPLAIVPWYRGFEGSIVPVTDSQSYDVHGIVLRGESDNVFKVRELPIRTWTTPFKEFIEAQMVGSVDNGKAKFVKEYTDHSTEKSVLFDLILTPEAVKQQENENTIHKKLKLTSSLTTSNMMLFDSEGRIAKYNDTTAIFKEFFAVRMNMYQKRREYLLSELQSELDCLDNKQRFILAVVEGKLKVAKRKKADIIADLIKKGFKRIPKSSRRQATEKSASYSASPDDDTSETFETDGESEDNHSSTSSANERDFDYLLSMPLWSLTMERVESLIAQRDEKAAQRDEMLRTRPSDLWLRDLENLEQVLRDEETEASRQATELKKAAREARRERAAGHGRIRQRSKTVNYEDDDAIDESTIIAPPSTRKERPRGSRKPPDAAAKQSTSAGPNAQKRRAQNQVKPKKSVVLEEYDSESESIDELDLVCDSESDVASESDDQIESAADPDTHTQTTCNPATAVSGTMKSNGENLSIPKSREATENSTDSALATALATALPDKKCAATEKTPADDEGGTSSSESDDDRGNLSLAERLALRGRQAVSRSRNEADGQERPQQSRAAVNTSKRPRNTHTQRPTSHSSSVIDVDLLSPSPAQRKKRSRIRSPLGGKGNRRGVRRGIAPRQTKKVARVLEDDEDLMDEEHGTTIASKPARNIDRPSKSQRDTDMEPSESEIVDEGSADPTQEHQTMTLAKSAAASSKYSAGGRAAKNRSSRPEKTSGPTRKRQEAPKAVREEEDFVAEVSPVQATAKPPARPRRATTRKPIIEISSDEDASRESDFQVNDDTDDSDFE